MSEPMSKRIAALDARGRSESPCQGSSGVLHLSNGCKDGLALQFGCRQDVSEEVG